MTTRKNERILVILNPSSGAISTDEATSFIFKKLRKHFDTVSLINSNSAAHTIEIVNNSLDQFDIITAFGGDGTINSVATALIGTGKTLGVLPGGSGNGLVRNLNIPVSWKHAVETLISGQDVYVDSGMINGKHFFNVAGIGLDGLVSKRFNMESKTRGISPYVYYAFKSYFECKGFPVTIKTADQEFEETISLIAFANFRQYGSKVIISPFSSPFDKKLDICILKPFTLVKASRYITYLFTGNIHKVPFYRTFAFDKCEIISHDGLIPFHFDGEYGGDDSDHYKIEVLPASVRIRIPGETTNTPKGW